MKILIIDDDDAKVESIQEEIKKIDEDIDIKIADNVVDSQKLLKDNKFSIVVLDLNLPFKKGESPQEYQGYELFRQVSENNIYIKPDNILILTSHENLKDKYKEDVDKGCFQIIIYSAFESEWKTKLISAIQYRLQISDDRNIYDNKDMAIITAVGDESKQLLNLIVDKKEIHKENDPTIYIEGFLEKGNKRVSVVCVQQEQMGMVSCAVLVSKLIGIFNPKYAVMVGIAAARKGVGNFGDILAATDVLDYTSGKMKGNSEEFIFEPDPKYMPVSTAIKNYLQLDYTKILSEIEEGWAARKPDSRLKLILGPLACGTAVVENEDVLESYIVPHNRKVIGLDMESYGFMYAVNSSYNCNTKGIILKSISDFANSDKDDSYHSYAAYTSAKFLYYLALEKLF